MEVHLRGQEDAITLAEVEEGDATIAGTTRSGKRFVTLRDRVRRDDLPIRHPYRVYLRFGGGFRAIEPSFADAEEWFVNGDDKMDFTMPDGREVVVGREEVLSLLSATPEDEAAAIANNN